jgi:asparagine synthase (glutamine-hydrolysing)
MSMAHGLESRVPFLDHPLVELASTIPANVKFLNGELKRLLKESFSHKLPKAIRERKDKMGFPVPLNEWLGEDFIEKTRNQLCKGQLVEQKIVNAQALEALLNTSVHADAAVGMKIWMLVNLELFLQKYFS